MSLLYQSYEVIDKWHNSATSAGVSHRVVREIGIRAMQYLESIHYMQNFPEQSAVRSINYLLLHNGLARWNLREARDHVDSESIAQLVEAVGDW